MALLSILFFIFPSNNLFQKIGTYTFPIIQGQVEFKHTIRQYISFLHTIQTLHVLVYSLNYPLQTTTKISSGLQTPLSRVCNFPHNLTTTSFAYLPCLSIQRFIYFLMNCTKFGPVVKSALIGAILYNKSVKSILTVP